MRTDKKNSAKTQWDNFLLCSFELPFPARNETNTIFRENAGVQYFVNSLKSYLIQDKY